MSEEITYPEGVPYRTPRPREEVASAAFSNLLKLTDEWKKKKSGAVLSGELSSQPLTLNQAIRNYFQQKGLKVVGFYRLGRYAVEIVFRYGDNAYWEVKSSAPKLEDWDIESLNDWLYGDLTEVQLPKKLEEINSRLNK